MRKGKATKIKDNFPSTAPQCDAESLSLALSHWSSLVTFSVYPHKLRTGSMPFVNPPSPPFFSNNILINKEIFD